MWVSAHTLPIIAIALGALYVLVDSFQRPCHRQHRYHTYIRDERRRRAIDRRRTADGLARKAVECSEPMKRIAFARRAAGWAREAAVWNQLADESDRQARWWDFLR
jgi:hypothetical protein